MGTKTPAKKKSGQRAPAANILESIGAGPAPTAGAATPERPKNLRLDGLQRSKDVHQIPIGKIMADAGQPRKEFEPESMRRLAASLASSGQLQPIRVWWSAPDEKYIIIVGERRWRAARMAKLETLTCVVHEAKPTEKELRALQLIENCVREDLKPVERAESMRDLMIIHGYGQVELGKELGFSQPSIAQALALLDLPDDLRAKVDSGKLSAQAAYQLTQLPNADEQREVAARIETEGLTRDEVRKEVKERKVAAKAAVGPGKGRGAAKGPKARAPKVRTEVMHNNSGYRIAVTNRKGIDDSALALILRNWASDLAPAG